MYEIKVKGLDALIKKLGRATAQEKLEKPMNQGALNIARWAKDKRLSGPRPEFLGVRSGLLRASISVARSIDRNKFEFIIGTNVKYARIHEYGGTIRPKAKGFLAWRDRGTGKWIFTRKSVRIPARPFLTPAIENKENQQGVVSLVQRAIDKELSK